MLTWRRSKLQTVDLPISSSAGIGSCLYEPMDTAKQKCFHCKGLRYIEFVLSSVACFAGGHRTMSNRHFERLDTHFRKLCRSIVGPPRGTDSALEWHEILNQWNVRVTTLQRAPSTWSLKFLPNWSAIKFLIWRLGHPKPDTTEKNVQALKHAPCHTSFQAYHGPRDKICRGQHGLLKNCGYIMDKALETWRASPISTQNEATGQQTIFVEELSCKAASPVVFKLEMGEPYYKSGPQECAHAMWKIQTSIANYRRQHPSATS